MHTVAGMSDSTNRVAAVVFNPVKVDVDALRDAVESAASDAGWGETRWFETSAEDPGQGAARAALDAGADLVLAAGGDGTVRAVAEAMRGSGVPVALLPSGTGNLLARNLDLTLDDMPDSVTSAFTGVDRGVDLGMIDIEREDGSRDRHAFVVMAGMGLDAKMIENTDEDLKAKAGWAAYVKATVASLRDPGELRLRFRVDDGRLRRATVHTVILGNCGSLPANILLLPDASIDDGRLDLMLMRPRNALGWVRVWFEIAWTNGVLRRLREGARDSGERRVDDDLRYETAERFVARLERPDRIELDGDEFGIATAFRAWIEPGALKVRVPRDA